MNTPPVELEVLPPALSAGLPAIPSLPQTLEVSGSVDRVRQYSAASQAMSRASLAMQVMAGFELLELHKKSPYRHGGKRQKPELQTVPESSPRVSDLKQGPYDGCHTWAEFCGVACGISPDTARAWMAMAEAVKPRLKKLQGFGGLIRELLTRPVSDLSADQTQLLTDAVSKITDGRTQLDFLSELGLVKRPGNPNLGGATAGQRKGKGVIDDETVKSAAREEWDIAQKALIGQGMNFTVLPDSVVEGQIECLMRALHARREWIKTPLPKRNPALVAALGKHLAA